MENNPLRGLFRVSSPRPEEQRVATQPTEPTEIIYYEIWQMYVKTAFINGFLKEEVTYDATRRFCRS